MKTGINSLGLTPQGAFRSSRHTCRKPLLLILPSRRATKRVADHSSLQPLEWSAFDWLFRSCSRTGRRSSPTSFFGLSYGAARNVRQSRRTAYFFFVLFFVRDAYSLKWSSDVCEYSPTSIK